MPIKKKCLDVVDNSIKKIGDCFYFYIQRYDHNSYYNIARINLSHRSEPKKPLLHAPT